MDVYNDIPAYLVTLLEHNRTIDVADAEFRRIMADDPELRDAYRDWCSENGYNPRTGFRDYAEEYLESRESIWDSLNDYDEEN